MNFWREGFYLAIGRPVRKARYSLLHGPTTLAKLRRAKRVTAMQIDRYSRRVPALAFMVVGLAFVSLALAPCIRWPVVAWFCRILALLSTFSAIRMGMAGYTCRARLILIYHKLSHHVHVYENLERGPAQ